VLNEWITTNGLGGYSSSTIVGANTRKYHGLLVVPTALPPFERKLLLSKVEEEIRTGLEIFRLSVNEYPGNLYPSGHLHLKQFKFEPLPTFTYDLPGFTVKKTIFMPNRTDAVVVNYNVWNLLDKPARMIVYPIVNSRGIHQLTKAGYFDFRQSAHGRRVEVVANYQNAPPLLMGSDLMGYTKSSLPEDARWYRNFVYRQERERGYEFMEDNYCPGSFQMEIRPGKNDFNFLAAGGFLARKDFEVLYSEKPERFEHKRRATVERLDGLVRTGAVSGTHWGKHLTWAADSFIINSGIIAGYHWFGCWGRDTLISFPGLTLVTARHDVAKRILMDIVNRQKEGLVPNWFEGETSDYNCADASLLFIYAVHKYLTYTDDMVLANSLWTSLEEIVDSYIQGANEGIKVDEDGLVWSSRATWMDASVNGRLVVPRVGKAVEVNALWYNSLRAMDEIGRRIGKPPRFMELADDVKENFVPTFWNEKKSCLHDVVSGTSKDGRVRPNQVFAVSLPFPVVEGDRARAILKTIEEKLLTPYGLRSLARDEPDYKGKCQGDATERDLAYHQGTVWSWLIGPFVTAFVRQGGDRARAQGFLDRLVESHLMEAGVGTVSEIFDGDPPHDPRGCISQAWSVGEILRCYAEDVKGIKPLHESKYGFK
jgi:predicted glycogen debranching enzyme